jgi:hypothetical protein
MLRQQRRGMVNAEQGLPPMPPYFICARPELHGEPTRLGSSYWRGADGMPFVRRAAVECDCQGDPALASHRRCVDKQRRDGLVDGLEQPGKAPEPAGSEQLPRGGGC